MGKRSEFTRNVHDTYDTPYKAVLPLLPFLKPQTRYKEPCAGKGDLVEHLNANGHVCEYSCDLYPRSDRICQGDVFDITGENCDCFITNPPWTREILHPLIVHLSDQHPTWLLFDADWPHTKQAKDLIKRCSLIVSVGRLKWIPDSKHDGKDNCCWYRFDPGHTEGPRFVGRT